MLQNEKLPTGMNKFIDGGGEEGILKTFSS